MVSPEKRKWFIYKITNPSGNVYIGKTCSLKSRVSCYRAIGKAVSSQRIICNSIRKHGFDNHVFQVIDEFISNSDYASGKEVFWIRSHMTNLNKYRDGNGMNLTDGGEGAPGAKFPNRVSPNKGKKMSEKAKQALRDSHKKYPQIPSMLGKKLSKESKEKMSLAKKGMVSTFKGKRHTEETKKILSDIHKGRPSPNKGKHTWSEDDKRRIGLSKIGNTNWEGKKMSEESRVRCSNAASANRGKPILQFSDEGVFIKEHIAIKVASKCTGIDRTVIKNSLLGIKTKSTNNKFYYKCQ